MRKKKIKTLHNITLAAVCNVHLLAQLFSRAEGCGERTKCMSEEGSACDGEERENADRVR